MKTPLYGSIHRATHWLGLVALLLCTTGFHEPGGCRPDPTSILVEAGESCALTQVECAAGLDCVSHYDGGQMICRRPCAGATDCSGTQVCVPAPQISDYALSNAPLVCQNACTDLPGSGCGGEAGSPEAVVKWEVDQVGGLYNLRGINEDGQAYLDATIEWAGDDFFTVSFESPQSCQVAVSIAEAKVYFDTCDEEAAEAISSAGIALFTDMEGILAEAKADTESPWVTKACPWVLGGLGAASVALFGAGAFSGASMVALISMGGPVVGAGGLIVGAGLTAATPAIAAFAGTAIGCWLYDVVQDPPLAKCVESCGFGTTPCFDSCIDWELAEDDLDSMVLFPQCVFACQQDDENCFDSCSYLLL